MSISRRRLIRPPTSEPSVSHVDPRTVQRLQERLACERQSLARWLKRLRRAFNAFEKAQKRVVLLEKKHTRLLGGGG